MATASIIGVALPSFAKRTEQLIIRSESWISFLASILKKLKQKKMGFAGSIIFLAYFITRLAYRIFITRDLKENMDELYIGLTFMGIWAGIYFWVFFK